jgi:hypothetical protein
MMIALSVRVEEDFFGSPGNDHPEKWFWIMINNLDLLDMDDANFDMHRVSNVLGKMLSRDIGRMGEGGLFPLRSHHKGIRYRDQRNEPIWEQMCAFLRENNFY